MAEYHYTILAAYLYFLRRMGQDDGGLLCFCYSCEYEVGFYMELSSMDDNPVVTDDIRDPNAESFEKYLFQRAFHMYQHSFAHRYAYSTLKSDSVCHEEKDKDDCRTCPYQWCTEKERMDWVVQTANTYDLEKAWFSVQTHFICYTFIMHGL